MPVSSLLSAYGVDGYLSRDGGTIYIDEGVYAHRKLYRYRFTLAHELGHWYLHERLFASAHEYATVDEWREWLLSIPEIDRRYYEWQAYAFAGLILVPAEPLATILEEGNDKFKSELGRDLDLEAEAEREYLAEWVGRRFEVSGQVILKRGAYDEHWTR